MTFDLLAAQVVATEYGWQQIYEAFGVCRRCKRTTVHVLADSPNKDYNHLHRVGLFGLQEAVNNYVTLHGFISLKDRATVASPDHVPDDIAEVFAEGATCLAVGCYNAAGTMFRLCVDLATKALLPTEEVEGLGGRTRRDLGLRLPWLFANGKLPPTLAELSTCVREDGNDAAHAGNLQKEDAEDLLDFTTALLERLYTEPAQLRLAGERRLSRRRPS